VRPHEFRSLLERARTTLAREAPGHYARFAALLEDAPLRIDVDRVPLLLRFCGNEHRLDDDDAWAASEVRADAATILALLDGELTLVDAALGERLFLRGSLESVARFERGLELFMDGAVRSPSMPALLQELRSSMRRNPETSQEVKS
jgi:hypothetical protein